MIRVGFVLESDGWQGGVNYYRNLLSALELFDNREICPVMFVGARVSDDVLSNFHNVEIVRTSILDPNTPGGLLRRVIKKLLGQRDLFLRLLMVRHHINVLSHSGPLWPKGKIKTIGWIADFQHLHLPEFFSTKECIQRNEYFKWIAKDCDRVLLSSEAAQRDLAVFAPAAIDKSRVLRFIPEVDMVASQKSIRELEEKYDFTSPYFFLPNQFWIHKNHKIVLEALAELKNKGFSATVLATGSKQDYRHPLHFSDLMAQIDRDGLTDAFKVLGIVPYSDLLSLMRHSLAVINPSLFEGWSSTVEEAKALGITILLSDLPVHREQDPPNGVFFDPVDAKALASKMLLIMTNSKGRSVDGDMRKYCDSYFSDRLRFAQEYHNIVLDTYTNIATKVQT